MATKRCERCDSIVIEAIDTHGNQLELVRYRGPRVYGVRNVLVHGIRGNQAFPPQLWVEHECTKMPETLGDPARTPIQEFGATLGDPAPRARGLIGGNELDHDDRGNPL